MNKPSPDTRHVLIVQAWEWARGFAAASTGTGNFHCMCVKLRSSLKEKVNICADLGTIQETIRGFPNGMWSEQPTCQVLNHPRGCSTETGECQGCCAGGLGPFQTQLLEQPACSTQVHGGVCSLCRLLADFSCAGCWGPVVQLFQALLVLRCLVRRQQSFRALQRPCKELKESLSAGSCWQLTIR